ncbi:ferredoxin-type protein NapF [Psychromonas ossibalaenae]|uniref:ferredoxin-type protein NapF n=1 Tax=Psychromonas ossibalaenae TaxID=444922 RepID=UPI00036B4760|nr:ferredoxin-type protein NapF [Psychromonas ossibalaenae]
MVLFNSNKRSLFRSKSRIAVHNLPPWIEDAQGFINNCSKCADCISVCPEKILKKGDGGYPQIDFNLGECSFCGKCADSCNEQIFTDTAQTPWNKKAQISTQCLAAENIYCRSCGESCESLALTFKIGINAVPQINTELCTGCGACVSPCPTQAIEIKEL